MKEKIKQRVKRFAKGYTGLLILVGVLSALLVVCMYFAWVGTSQWIETISDPTERGLAYIAAAVVFHAFFGKSRVNVKTNKI